MSASALTDMKGLANAVGMFASILFTLQYFPQAMLNFRRKSTEGFSTKGIIIKLIGASFLAVNAYVNQEALAVVAYGGFNIFQHSVFMVQFYQYEKKFPEQYVVWLLFPLVPYMLALYVPWTIPFTNSIKPLGQVASHIPQLITCIRMKSTEGVSLITQHMNLIGGLCGLFMCSVIPPKSSMTYLLYTNSMLQALTLYAVAAWFDWGWFGKKATRIIHADKDMA